eukprot:TRINITY_DN66527_c4_g1_i1.p2 TRINITY_DN66527_c4_g1~~TRINITY_DN66527_c4_g1_i1.p2  ORF type:complete len:139 (+),score=4.93 TRINITY_DN66527_c4_g1_i1:237-653(+)
MRGNWNRRYTIWRVRITAICLLLVFVLVVRPHFAFHSPLQNSGNQARSEGDREADENDEVWSFVRLPAPHREGDPERTQPVQIGEGYDSSGNPWEFFSAGIQLHEEFGVVTKEESKERVAVSWEKHNGPCYKQAVQDL